ASISHPPTYMGLRTSVYGPTATNTRGGSNGAGVPRPRTTKRLMQVSARTPPQVSSTIPSGGLHDGRTRPSRASKRRVHNATEPHNHTNAEANTIVRSVTKSTFTGCSSSRLTAAGARRFPRSLKNEPHRDRHDERHRNTV